MEKSRVNFAVKVVGWLGHDNKLFDRTCTVCGGMYSSYEHAFCIKCHGELTFITTSDGKPMAVSEGSIYPAFGQKTKERYLKSIEGRKNAMEAVWRFKIFSFADDNGVLTPPAEHMFLKKGALVEIIILNHPIESSWFTNRYGQTCVEHLFKIFPHYGDTVKVLQGKAAAEATISHEVNVDGSPAPVDPPYPINDARAQLAAMEQQLAELKAVMVSQAFGATAPETPAQEDSNDTLDTFEDDAPF